MRHGLSGATSKLSRAIEVVFEGEGVEENEKVFLDGRKMGQS